MTCSFDMKSSISLVVCSYTVGIWDKKSVCFKLLSHFLFVWAQTLQDGGTLYSKKSYVFQFHKIETRLTTKFKFQVMGKEINNLERVWCERKKCEKKILEKLNCFRRYKIKIVTKWWKKLFNQLSSSKNYSILLCFF